ncbi:phasin family protein [Methylocystis echinoides]|jgi:hypothetical protein|uniref:phasin family protein n=1 Tax=Methylocystis echinoides TaxID=29468 RepID=UPI0034325716
MATKSKADKSIPLDAGQAAPAEAPEEALRAEIPAQEPVLSEAASPAAPAPTPEPEIVDIVSAPLAVIEEAAESAAESFSASFEFDTSAWSKKSLELWAENAAAFLEFAEQVVKAKSFEEAVDIQSRFASERFEAFVRQSQELMDVAKNLASFAAAPLCDVRKAA